MAEQGADLRGKSGLCRVSEVCKPELWVTRWFPKPSPKRDRAITKATVVSPLSPHCQPVLRVSTALCRANGIIYSQLRTSSHVSEALTYTGPSHKEGDR